MRRFLYDRLLRMHPLDFRNRFAAEMMLNFDEAEQSEKTVGLFLDCLVSLLRQWLLRSGSWKLIPAVLCAFLQVTVFSWHLRVRPHPAMGSTPVDLGHLVLFIAAITVAVAVMTALCVRNFVARRVDGRSRTKRSPA